MEQIITCPKCGSKIYHNKGISQKNNKPYENYKCGSCDYIKWVDLREQKPEPRSEQPNDLQMIMDALTTLDKGQRETWKVLMAIQTKLNEKK